MSDCVLVAEIPRQLFQEHLKINRVAIGKNVAMERRGMYPHTNRPTATSLKVTVNARKKWPNNLTVVARVMKFCVHVTTCLKFPKPLSYVQNVLPWLRRACSSMHTLIWRVTALGTAFRA